MQKKKKIVIFCSYIVYAKKIYFKGMNFSRTFPTLLYFRFSNVVAVAHIKVKTMFCYIVT